MKIRKAMVIILVGVMMMSACIKTNQIKKLDLSNIVFTNYYYGSQNPIPAWEKFSLYRNEINPGLFEIDSWKAIKQPNNPYEVQFTLEDTKNRTYAFCLYEEQLLVIIEDSDTLYYYQGKKETYIKVEAEIQRLWAQHDVPDLSNLTLTLALPLGHDTLLADIIVLSAIQNTQLISRMKMNEWIPSNQSGDFFAAFELIIKDAANRSFGFKKTNNQELLMIYTPETYSGVFYELPSLTIKNLKDTIFSWKTVVYPNEAFLNTIFTKSYIGHGDGFSYPQIISEYIYTLNSSQKAELNDWFDLSQWEKLNAIPYPDYVTFALMDENNNEFYFSVDGGGSVVKVIPSNSQSPIEYYAIRNFNSSWGRQELVDWYIPQKASDSVKAMMFSKVFSGYDEGGLVSEYLYDLSSTQASTLKSLFKMDQWILAYDIPAMGGGAKYVVKTDDQRSVSINFYNNKTWFMIIDESNPYPQILGYFAPIEVFEDVVKYLKDHES